MKYPNHICGEIDGRQRASATSILSGDIESSRASKNEMIKSASRREQEAIMSTGNTADRAAGLFAEPERLAALNAVLARNWWALAIRGLLGIAVGVIAFLMPAATMLALVLLFAAYMLADGVFAIVAAVRAARRHERWAWLVLEGVADIAAGAIAALWPGITVVALVLLVAAWALVSGTFMVMAAFRLNIDHGRWWLVLGGFASIIYGLLLLIAPLIGALVLTWWFGAYALIFGAALLMLAFRLKARNDERHPATVRNAV
jgi:uncharacterized membrane protein HdeD (DUF308 family)